MVARQGLPLGEQTECRAGTARTHSLIRTQTHLAPQCQNLGNRHLDRKIHTHRYRHMWSPHSYRRTPTHTTDKLGHAVAWTQNQVKSMETCQDTDRGRHTGTHQEPHVQMHPVHRHQHAISCGHRSRLGHPKIGKDAYDGHTCRHSLMYRRRHTHRDKLTFSWSKIQVIFPSHPSFR